MKGKIVIPNLQEEELTLNKNQQIKKTKLEIQSKAKIIVLLIILFVLLIIALVIYTKDQNNSSINSQPQLINQQTGIVVVYNEEKSNKQEQYIEQSQQHQIQNINKTERESTNQSKQIRDRQKDSFAKHYSQTLINNNALYSFFKKRISIFQNHLSPYKKLPKSTLQSQIGQSNITKYQFGRAIELIAYSPLILNNSQRISNALAQQQLHYESKYNINAYRELSLCVVVPSYKNFIKYRYFLNLYTILQQDYSNYHVIIIDDASQDHTADKIQKQLQSNPFARSKVTLIKNHDRQFHMANIYYAVYNHCKAGEILAVIDGDDELVGKQVFKLINAVYHQTKAFSIYTNHIESKKDVALEIGISKEYPKQIISNNSFRQSKHYYSHLKTAWVDLFLQIKQQSLKTREGKWYNNAVDNAIFLSIFEMSCGRVQYVPEITYKYNTFTGNSIANMEYGFRKATADQIKKKQKYKCINQTRPDIYEKILSYME